MHKRYIDIKSEFHQIAIGPTLHLLCSSLTCVFLLVLPIAGPSTFLLGGISEANPTVLSASGPFILSTHSYLYARVGYDLVVASTYTNNDDLYDWSANFIVEVRDTDAQGVTVLLDWQSGTVAAGKMADVGISWIPEHAGTYELRTFAISSFDNPRILSTISRQEVTIT